MLFSDEYFMNMAFREAEKAFARDEIPIGAVVVLDNNVIGKGHNLTESLNDITAHAEMQAVTAAANYLGAKYLNDCTLYVTLEPCVMCAGALFWTQLGRLVYGATDLKRGYTLIQPSVIHPKTTVLSGVMEKECAEIILSFFKEKRKK